ncbi:5445_t:CDS:2, partial [Racocetra fulgida]
AILAQKDESCKEYLWLLNNPQPTDRFAQWIMIAAEYLYTICYRKGLIYANVDVLSKIPH